MKGWCTGVQIGPTPSCLNKDTLGLYVFWTSTSSTELPWLEASFLQLQLQVVIIQFKKTCLWLPL